MRIALLRGAAAPRRPALELGGDDQQVVREDGRPDEHLEAVAAMEGTALHAPAAEEDGDPALDARPEPLAPAEDAALFRGAAGGRLRPATLRNTLRGHAGGVAAVDGGEAVEPAIGGVEGWGRDKPLLVAHQ